jgi:hypothetical protein
MVKGLETFREHFRNYADRYVLIDGTACDIAMTGAGLAFRATKDLDIVLYVEALDAVFVRAFWEFVRAGGYEVQEKSTGEKQFYRFQKPTNADYPFMLELFSRQPDVLQVAEGSHLTPLPTEEDTSSLSAILLDNDYYDFICAGRQEIDGIPMVGAGTFAYSISEHWWIGRLFLLRHQRNLDHDPHPRRRKPLRLLRHQKVLRPAHLSHSARRMGIPGGRRRPHGGWIYNDPVAALAWRAWNPGELSGNHTDLNSLPNLTSRGRRWHLRNQMLRLIYVHD